MKYTLVGKKTGLEIPVTNIEESDGYGGWWATVDDDGYRRWFSADKWDLATDQSAEDAFLALNPPVLMAIEDYSSRRLKRFYFRSLRGAWRHAKWVQNHSSWTMGYEYHRDMMKDYRMDVESARTELAHRHFYVG